MSQSIIFLVISPDRPPALASTASSLGGTKTLKSFAEMIEIRPKTPMTGKRKMETIEVDTVPGADKTGRCATVSMMIRYRVDVSPTVPRGAIPGLRSEIITDANKKFNILVS